MLLYNILADGTFDNSFHLKVGIETSYTVSMPTWQYPWVFHLIIWTETVSTSVILRYSSHLRQPGCNIIRLSNNKFAKGITPSPPIQNGVNYITSQLILSITPVQAYKSWQPWAEQKQLWSNWLRSMNFEFTKNWMMIFQGFSIKVLVSNTLVWTHHLR